LTFFLIRQYINVKHSFSLAQGILKRIWKFYKTLNNLVLSRSWGIEFSSLLKTILFLSIQRTHKQTRSNTINSCVVMRNLPNSQTERNYSKNYQERHNTNQAKNAPYAKTVLQIRLKSFLFSFENIFISKQFWKQC